MGNKFKRFLALMLAVVMVIGMMPQITIDAKAEETTYVAKIGETGYVNFAEAMTAANAMTGDVVVDVYGEVEFADGMELNGSYTSITFNGKAAGAKITINQTAGGDYLEAHGKTVAFNDLTLAKANPAWSDNSGHMGNYFSVQGGTVTYNNCTFPNGACTSGGTATYNNCTFQNTSEYGLWVYDDALVTVNGGTIDSTKGIKVYSEDEASVTSTLTVQNATFTENVTAKPAVAVGYAESITLIGNTYKNTTAVVELDSGSDADCEGITFVAQDAEGNDIASTLTVVDRSNNSAACGVLVNGKIYTNVTTAAEDAVSGDTVILLYDSAETVELPEGVTLNTNGHTAENVTVKQPAATNVAKVGDTEYATIDEAIAAWTNGTTLTLLADVTLSDVVTLKSTEHHILNLGTYTLTAAEGKNAFVIQACGTGSAEKSTITINADATNPGGINAGSKCVVYYKYADGGISTEDRPIIKINGGVFTGSTSSWGTAGIYTIGTAARKCATVNISGGTFNCSIVGSGKSKLIISGGTFNYTVSSQGDSTCSRLISGGTFKTIGFMTADSNNTKFWIGTSMGNSNVGVYVDDNGYIVVGGPVVTEPGETFEASSANYSGASSYLQYSSAVDNGLYYTSVEEALADNNKSSGSVTVYLDELDMTGISYAGTIVVPAESSLTITNAPADLKVTDAEGNVLEPNANGTYTTIVPEGTINGGLVNMQNANRTFLTIESYITYANESIVVKVFDANGTLLATSTLVDTNRVLLGNKNFSLSTMVGINCTDEWWNTVWEANKLRADYVPANATLYVDGVEMNTAPIQMRAAGSETAVNWAEVPGVPGVPVAKIGETGYETVAAALAAAKDGDTITLISGENVISMAGSVVGGKTVTITGTAIVDWTKGNLFVGRGGEGDGKVIFDGANITSYAKKTVASTGIHVSGSKNTDANTNNGVLVIKDSNIELDYLINRNEVTVEGNSKLTIYGGTYTHGRNASESASGNAETATLTIEAGATVTVVNENSMGVGGESNGVMTVKGTYEANVLNISSIGTVNVEGGSLKVAGNVNNNGELTIENSNLTDATIAGTGTTYFAGDVEFNGTNSVTTGINGSDFELIVNKGATLLISRFVLGYNRNITVYGEIEDAHAFDPTGKTPSLKFNSTSGVSVGGTGTGNLTVKNAYVELGNSSWKNAYGTYDWNFENSYVSATSFTNNNARGSESATWNVTFDDSVLVAKNYIKNGVGTTYNFTNGSVGTTGSLRIDGVLNIDETSSVTTTAQQNNVVGAEDEHGGINGTVNVKGNLTIGSTSKTQLEVLGGELNVEGNGKVALGTNTLTLDENSKLTIDATGMNAGDTYTGIEGVVTNNGTIEVVGSDLTAEVDENGNIVLVAAPVAQIGDVKYETLQAAIDAATAGQTITLIADITEDVTVSKSLTIDGANFKYTGNISVSVSTSAVTVKNVNFVDGTGYAITTNRISSITVENCTVSNYGFGFLYANKSTPTIVVKNVTVDGGSAGINWNYGTSATLENVVISNVENGIYTRNYGTKTLTIKNCEINATNPIYIDVKDAAQQTFVFEGTNTLVGAVSLNDYGTLKLNAEATLTAPEGLTVTTDAEKSKVVYEEGVYKVVPKIDAAKIGDTVYDSIQEAVAAAKDGDVITVINDHELVWDGETKVVDTYAAFVLVRGKAVTIDLNGHALTGSSDISGTLLAAFAADRGGSLTLIDSKDCGSVSVTGDKAAYSLLLAFDPGDKLTVNGGSYYLQNASTALIFCGGNSDGVYVNGGNFKLDNIDDANSPWIFNVVGAGDNHVNVTGGTFNADINRQKWSNEVLVSETCYTVNNGDGTWTVKEGAVAYVQTGMTTGPYFAPKNIGYATLEEAIAAAIQYNDPHVTLLADYNGSLEIKGEVKLHLNGHTIKSDVSTIVVDGGDLTIDNGKTSVVNLDETVITEAATVGKVITTDATGDYEAIAVKNNGKLTLNGGAVESGRYGIYAYSNIGTVVMNGGTVKAPYMAIAVSGGSAAISGGTLICDESWIVYDWDKGLITITGGIFSQNPDVAYIAYGYGAQEITVDGATYYQVTEIDPVAYIGETGYYTVDAAIAAAQAGDVIVVNSCTVNGDVSINKDVTVQAAEGAVVTINGQLQITADGAAVKGLTVVSGGTALYINAKDVLVENCDITGAWAGMYQSYTTGKVTFKDSKITGKAAYAIHFDGSAGGEIVIDNCELSGWTSFAASIKNVTITDTEFVENDVYNYVRFYQENVVIDGCTFNEKMAIDLVDTETVTVTGSTVENGTVEGLFSDADIVDSAITVDGVLLKREAKIGNTYYKTLDEAFAAAQDGDEIEILEPGTYALTTSGKNITITGAVDGVVFDNIGAKNMGGANVTFNNVTFDYYPNVNYTGLQHSGNLVYNNCIINGQVFLYGTSETFNKCTFNQNSADAYNVWTYGAKEVAFNECTFNSVGKSVLIYSEQSDLVNNVTVTKSTFNASAPVEGKAAIEMDSSLTAGINLTIDGETTATGFDNGNVSNNSLWNNKKDNKTDANNDITVVVAGETVLAPVTFVAKIGEIGYTSIADAMKAAQAGDTVTILAGDYTTDITVNNGITVVGETDENGNNLVNITGRVSAKTGATVKNLNVHNEKTGQYDCALVVNGKDIVIDGVKLTGYNGMRYCYANGDITVKNSTINGSNFAVHFDGSEGGNIAFVDCDITGWCSYASTFGAVSYTNCSINQGNYSGHRYYNKDISFTNCDFADGFKIDLEKSGSNVAITDADMTVAEAKALFVDPYYVAKGNVTLNNEKLTYVASAYTANGSKYFDSLQDAVDEVIDGGYINVLSDVALTETLKINKPVTLGLNGKTITSTAKCAVEVSGGNADLKVVIESGSIIAAAGNGTSALSVYDGADVTLDDVALSGGYYGIKLAGYHSYPSDVNNNNLTSVVLNGGSVTAANAAIIGLGAYPNTQIDINGATVTSNNSIAIYHPSYGTLNITEGSKVSGAMAIYMKAGNLNISGGEFIANGDKADYEYNYSGANSTGDAVVIESCNYGGYPTPVASITGGTFTSANNQAVASYNSADAEAVAGFVSGGTFNTPVAEEDCAAGYIPVENSDGTYGVKEGAYVAQIGETKYETFAEALNAVKDGETITVLNVESTAELDKEIDFTKAISFTITGNAPNYALPVVTFQNATVTIKDAEILIPELDARQNATINVIDSIVHDAGGNGIVKSYYNGAINISGTSVVYTMQVTTMGYITISDTAQLNATWQTNVYGNGMIVVKDDATFATAALHLTGQDYSGRDNTDAERVGKPATIVVDGAKFIVGKVYSDNGADYSYNSGKGINIGTVDGKSAVLDIKNSATVEVYMANGETANIGANGTVNVDASSFTVACRAADGKATVANNGTILVSGASDIAANVTGDGWVYMNGVNLDGDTKLYGAKVRFASGTNNIDGSVIDDGFFQVGIGAYNGVDANVDTVNGVVVNVKNAKIGSNGKTYAGWIGTGFYDTDAEKTAAMTDAKYVLNIENSVAEFGYLHVSNDGELNVKGNAAEKAHYNNSDYSFYAGDFIINGTATFDATDVLALYTKVSCDNGTDKPGTLNIVGGTEFEAERHNGAIAGTNFILYKTGVATVDKASELYVGEPASIAADATLNIGGKATVLGTVTNNGTINLTEVNATLTTPEAPVVKTTIDGYEVFYENGVYAVKKIKLFDLYGANMDLGNTLDMNFYFQKSHITDTGSYAVITKKNADGSEVSKTIYASDFASQSKDLYKITFAGIAAKEMADTITVTIYDSNGKQISNVWNDSVRAYSMRMLKKATTDVERTVFVDMLNYGAEAQKFFKYNEADYANSQLTAEQQGYATVLDSLENKSSFNKSYYYGANMDLESSIKFNMYFVRSKVTADMTVEISYTDHTGVEHEIVVDGSEFFEQSKDLWKVTVDGLVVADVKQIITVVVKDASGNEVTTIEESVESYLARQASASELYKAIMKFGLSANAYLHRNDK